MEQLIIYRKLYDLVLRIYPIVNRIPKGHRLVLGRQIEEQCIQLLLLVVRANKTRGEERVNLQQQISDDLDCLRILIRLTKDLKFMSIKQYAFVAEKSNEIAKMLNGWIKSN